MDNIPIPPEAVEAALLAWIGSESTIAEGMSHAIRAALAAWPGAYTDDETMYGKVIGKTIFLPPAEGAER